MDKAVQLYIGTAGWSLPAAARSLFDPVGSQLARYGSRLTCTEINSSFYRPHRPETYKRWGVSVPAGFRFAVKMPKTITHEARLADNDDALLAFLEQTRGLGDALGPILIQLPPSLAFNEPIVRGFLAMLRRFHTGPVVLEPRHRSWFASKPEELLEHFRVARAAADPAICAEAARPGGWPGLRYWRLHGSPKMYFSVYGRERLEPLRDNLKPGDWVIFDNTASGAAVLDALLLKEIMGSSPDDGTSGGA